MALQIFLINSEMGLRDNIPNGDFGNLKGKTFLDIANWLISKYQADIESTIGEDMGNIIAEIDRCPIRFEFLDDNDGSYSLVDLSERLDNHDGKQIYWTSQPLGGSNRIFNSHAFLILKDRKTSNWKSIFNNNVSKGIKLEKARVKRENIIRTFFVKPSEDYPRTPPIVSSIPRFSGDPCWDTNGILHYTTFLNKGGSPWDDLVLKYKNPLEVLIYELLVKYKIA